MAGQISVEEKDGKNVFNVVVPGGETMTMATSDTYVDKDIIITATGSSCKVVELPAEYGPGSAIDSSYIEDLLDANNVVKYKTIYYRLSSDTTTDTYRLIIYASLNSLDGGDYLSIITQDNTAWNINKIGKIKLPYYDEDNLLTLDINNDNNELVLTGANNTIALVQNETQTNDIDITFPHKSGTLALLSDVQTSDVTKQKIITALGYTPYDNANPRGFISTLSYTDVTNALGFIPYSSANPSNYISEITSDAIAAALGYTPYDSTNPNGYISSIAKADVTGALGYTPYNATNPSGYITKDVDNLTNYYDITTINNMVGAGIQMKVVTSLPTSGIRTNIIYLINVSGDNYEQWMYIDNEWVKTGTTSVNLSEYVKSSELASVATSGSYTSLTDRPEIPTDLSQLTNTAGYVTTTTTGLVNYTKTADLASVAISGSYNDLSNKPAIPTTLGSLTNDANYITINDLTSINVSSFINDVNYAKLEDITALQELDVNEIKEAIAITQNVGTIKGVTAGSGLTGGGTTGFVTLNHSNTITEKTAYCSTDTSVVSGGSFTVTDVKYDTNGHITGSQDRSITIPTIPDITGMMTTTNYSDTLDTVYQPLGNYQAAGDYLVPVSAVNDTTGNYVVNVTQTSRGQIAVTKGTLPSISLVEDTTPDTPTTDAVSILRGISVSGHSITEDRVNVPTQHYIDTIIGNINSILDAINGEVI